MKFSCIFFSLTLCFKRESMAIDVIATKVTAKQTANWSVTVCIVDVDTRSSQTWIDFYINLLFNCCFLFLCYYYYYSFQSSGGKHRRRRHHRSHVVATAPTSPVAPSSSSSATAAATGAPGSKIRRKRAAVSDLHLPFYC